jgi:hypothetical protein
MGPVEEVEGPLSKNQKFLMGQRKSCLPDTFQLGAIPDARAFLACRKINNLSVFNTPECSDSRRFHTLPILYINYKLL